MTRRITEPRVGDPVAPSGEPPTFGEAKVAIDQALDRLDANDIAGARKLLLAIAVRIDQQGEPPASDQPAASIDDDPDRGAITEARLRHAGADDRAIERYRTAAQRDPREADAVGRGTLQGLKATRARLADEQRARRAS